MELSSTDKGLILAALLTLKDITKLTPNEDKSELLIKGFEAYGIKISWGEIDDHINTLISRLMNKEKVSIGGD